jgi:hypothetical protein
MELLAEAVYVRDINGNIYSGIIMTWIIRVDGVIDTANVSPTFLYIDDFNGTVCCTHLPHRDIKWIICSQQEVFGLMVEESKLFLN